MNAGRPPRGDEPMTRRNIHLPDELWSQLEAYAAALGALAQRPVSVAEAVRRILERSMRARS